MIAHYLMAENAKLQLQLQARKRNAKLQAQKHAELEAQFLTAAMGCRGLSAGSTNGGAGAAVAAATAHTGSCSTRVVTHQPQHRVVGDVGTASSCVSGSPSWLRGGRW